jgi:hypothetical protein
MPCRQEQVPKISKNNVCVQFFTIFAPLKIQLYAPTRTLDPPPLSQICVYLISGTYDDDFVIYILLYPYLFSMINLK